MNAEYERQLDDLLRADGWEPCPFEKGCITWIKPDDQLGKNTHQREWHPEQIDDNSGVES